MESNTASDNQEQLAYCHRVFQAQQQAFRKQPLPTAGERKERLTQLKEVLLANQERLANAIDQDFGGRSKDETRIAELLPSIQGINHALKHLERWMRPSSRPVSMLFRPASNRVQYQPKGVVGIIVPWNYPLYLAVGPLIAALAAGNRCMIKMSEFTPATSALFRDLMAETFPEDQLAVILGDADVAADFSRRPFDHLLFTGSTSIGKRVMLSAAENLTPVTLELGGKSPALLAPDVPLHDAAQRIAFGKALNAGQTCVAPDYVLCQEAQIPAFVEEFRKAFSRMYPRLRDNPDYTSIVNDRQYQRLQQLLGDARRRGAELVTLNPADEDLGEDTRKMPMTLALNTTPDMTLRQDEIFGPILPVVGYQSLDQAIDSINDQPRPLALYFFGYDKAQQQQVLETTHSGGVCLNDTLMHVAQEDLPFGGIGDSGMGHYHGREGFLTFSHHRGVFARPKFNSGRFVYPPHGTLLHKLVYKLFIR